MTILGLSNTKLFETPTEHKQPFSIALSWDLSLMHVCERSRQKTQTTHTKKSHFGAGNHDDLDGVVVQHEPFM